MPGMEERSMMEKTIKKDIWEMISSVSYSTHIAGNAGRADQKFFEHLQLFPQVLVFLYALYTYSAA